MKNEVKNHYIFKKLKVNGLASLPYTSGWDPSLREDIIPDLIKDFDYQIGAEIGVQKGYFSRKILEKNPGIKMYCVDPYDLYETVRHIGRQERNGRLARLNLGEFNAEFIQKKSQDALADIEDNLLDFVYIDGLHDFDNVIVDIIGWTKKVKVGGLISGHDFSFANSQVIRAVEAYIISHNINPWFVTNEQHASWFWIKS